MNEALIFISAIYFVIVLASEAEIFPIKTIGDIIVLLFCLPALIVGTPVLAIFSGIAYITGKVWNFRIFK